MANSSYILSTLLLLSPIGSISSNLHAKEEITMKKEKSYATWDSPITADIVSQASKRLENIDIDKGIIYWTELRPTEKGRTVIVTENGDVTPTGYNVRTRVYEYGGKSFTVHEGVVYFINDEDQCIYVQKNNEVTKLTEKGIRFADLLWTKSGLVAVGEYHHPNSSQVDNFLALVDLETGDYKKIASGHDFYSSPAISPDGKKLAYLTWDFPNMPWDGTQLWVADLSDSSLENSTCIAGNETESIFQPQWSPDGVLYYVSDLSDFWNLYRFNDGKSEALFPKKAEFGLPLWVFGRSTYGFIDGKILCTYFENGVWVLGVLDPNTKKMREFSSSATMFTQIRCENNIAAFFQASPVTAPEVIKMNFPLKSQDLSNGISLTSAGNLDIDKSYFSVAKPISFPTTNGQTSYGYYYAPVSKDFIGLKGQRPPLIVLAHGGPTANVTGAFAVRIQYWTSRGFAVLDVNYRGSTGYGKAYRDALNGTWGVVDVEDCESGAKYLIEKGLADPQRVAIAGGSAGGYTTLAALAFGKIFQAGASHYGVSDPALLAKETHKFESQYLDRLIGPYPEKKDLYQERSPLGHVTSITSPVIFFQGDEDKIVPPDQAEIMFDALKKQGIETKLVMYQGEQHGFRNAKNIANSLDEELSFYLKVFYEKASK